MSRDRVMIRDGVMIQNQEGRSRTDATGTTARPSRTREPFRVLEAQAVPLLRDDIDTDQIIPASYLKVTDREGLAEGLFAHWRRHDDGRPNRDFPLEQERFRGAQILLVGDNFGCGSSREHAPWALLQNGFRVVISPRFADIFRANALGNGLLPLALPAAVIAGWAAQVDEDPRTTFRIDLELGIVTGPDDESHRFEIDPFSKHCLLEGLDPLGYLLEQGESVSRFEQARIGPVIDTRATAARVATEETARVEVTS